MRSVAMRLTSLPILRLQGFQGLHAARWTAARPARRCMSMAPLSQPEIEAAIQQLNGWVVEENGLGIRRTFQFDDFTQAWGWMSRIALHAEKNDHHPEWSNVYATVNVRLQTHDAGEAGGITSKDLELARLMDQTFGADD